MPIRMCAVCRDRFEKRELHRVVRTEDGEIRIDKPQKAQCRGIYICEKCLPDAEKKRVLERAYKSKIEPEVYEKLRSEAAADE